VGFLDRFRSQPTSRTAAAVAVLASRTLDVVGESYRQDTLRQVAAKATGSGPYLADLTEKALGLAEHRRFDRIWFRALLFREPDNPADTNAVAVHADGVGLIGYLSRDEAINYQPVFAALGRHGVAVASCPAFLTGGGPDMSYGAVLCISRPDKIVRDLADKPP
jgi:hypothetical protein